MRRHVCFVWQPNGNLASLAALIFAVQHNRDTVEDAEATGGVIDGGTWEHRKRAKEMLKTAETALNVTLQAKGAHHMGQYLPKDVSLTLCA